ncbi:MAG: YfhO family protein, partial [Bacilli bacterium]|nr:YfhO family protein [Bacilli bacterium]
MTREIIYLVIAFVFPLILISVLIGSSGISLFAYEGNTMIMSDMQSQYICYLRSFRNLLLNNGSFVYTTETVFGGDYMSIFTYYLASPFNYFVVFFDEAALPLFFVWSSILKMSFAGLNFYLLVRFSGKFSFQKLICALGYGLISYSFVYMFNFMWLDGVMILPLVVL